MKKTILFLVLFAASVANAEQVPVTQITGATASREALRTQINTRLSASHDNFTEIYTLLGGSPWLAQTTAPSIHNVFWIDTSAATRVIKYWDGDSWEVASAGGDGTYTLPSATTETKGGVIVGDRLTITTDGVLSADVQATDISGKQDTLVSGTNIKTINGTSVLGLGNIVIDGGSISLATEQNWTAMQNFNSGLTATGIELTLSALSDIKFGTGNWLDDTKGNGDSDYLWSADKIFDQLALKSDAAHNHTGTYEPADSTIVKVSEIDSLAEFEALLGWSPGSGGSFAFDAFPTYENSPHSSGIAVNGSTLAIYSAAASKWLTVGLTDTLNPAYSATLTITDASATGDTFTINSIAYDVADSPVSTTDLPTPTEAITYTGSNTANCTGDVMGTANTGPWSINASPATVECVITVATYGISDNFETNTIADWTNISGTLTIGAGVASVANYGTAYAYYNKTENATDDNWSEATINFSNAADYAGPICRWNATNSTGYGARLFGAYLRLYSYTGATGTVIGTYDPGNFEVSTNYKVKVQAQGTTIKVYLDDVERISVTDSTYSSGKSSGVAITRGGGGLTTVDNFSAGDL